MIQQRSGPAIAAAASLMLAACGGGSTGRMPEDAATKIEVLATASQGIGNMVYKDGAAWLTLSNSAQGGSAVMKTTLPMQAASRWTEVPLGACALPKQDASGMARTPMLRALGSNLWLFQTAQESRQGQAGEHSLCTLEASGTFAARDQPLASCIGEWCAPLAMNELKLAGNRLYTNAGAGQNLFVSDNAAASWRVVLGQFDSMVCTHQAFQVVGDRLLVGGECPLDSAYVRAYRLGADGRLASPAELPVALPKLENRNVQFIEQVANTQRVFAGVEGGPAAQRGRRPVLQIRDRAAGRREQELSLHPLLPCALRQAGHHRRGRLRQGDRIALPGVVGGWRHEVDGSVAAAAGLCARRGRHRLRGGELAEPGSARPRDRDRQPEGRQRRTGAAAHPGEVLTPARRSASACRQ
jgi:hypothetical protein